MSVQLTMAGEASVNECSATQATARCLDTVTSTSLIDSPLVGSLLESYANDPFLDEILNGAVLGSNEITDPYLADILFGAVPETIELADPTSRHVPQPARPLPHSIVAESFRHGFTTNEATILRSSSTIALNPVPDLTYNPIAAHTLGRANDT